jgi:hypothetical protein
MPNLGEQRDSRTRLGILVRVKTAFVIGAVLCSAAAVGQAVAAPPRPLLRLVDDPAPVTLRGSGFQPREHVRIVILDGSARFVRRAVATNRGRFAVRVDAGADGCTGFSAVAVGSRGSRATLKRPPGQCPQP